MQELMESLEPATQREAIPGREADMARNHAGGFSFTVDHWTQLDRFLILGTSGGTFYVEQKALTKENAAAVAACMADDGIRLVDRIVEISNAGRAPRNDQAIFALAMCVAQGDKYTKHKALVSLPEVCRIGTHLFMFMAFLKKMKGAISGRSVHTALGNWYTAMDLDRLAVQVTKYRNRHGWTHRDVLRQAHPKGREQSLAMLDLLSWVAQPDKYMVSAATPQALAAFIALQKAENAQAAASIVFNNKFLTHEMVPTGLKRAEVWEALMERGMPMTATVRNLPTMTRHGLLKPMSDRAAAVAGQLRDQERLHRARVHPMSLLIAAMTYAAGRSARGSAEWTPTPEIVEALDDAFYLAFDPIQKIGKRVYLGVDVSGSMAGAHLMDVPGLTPLAASAALAVCFARQFDRSAIFGFAAAGGSGYGFGFGRYGQAAMTDLGITARSSMKEALRSVSNLPFGGTDCSLPMRHALKEGIEADCFVVLTDNETWAGPVHASEALKEYRRRTGIDAKLIVCAMTATDFSIADPRDGGMLDVVGFDVSVPKIMEDFLA